MRYVQVTHTYVLPVSAEDEDSIDAIANEGVSIMENFMVGRAANILDLRSNWALCPREYAPSTRAEVMEKFSPPPSRERFRSDTIGHPWDDGIRVTPPGHELYEAETEALRQEGMLCGEEEGEYVCVAVKGHPTTHLWEHKNKVVSSPHTQLEE